MRLIPAIPTLSELFKSVQWSNRWISPTKFGATGEHQECSPLFQSINNAYDICRHVCIHASHSGDSNAVRIIQIGAWVLMICLMLSLSQPKYRVLARKIHAIIPRTPGSRGEFPCVKILNFYRHFLVIQYNHDIKFKCEP